MNYRLVAIVFACLSLTQTIVLCLARPIQGLYVFAYVVGIVANLVLALTFRQASRRGEERA